MKDFEMENLLISMEDVEEKEVSWLVPERIPKGQIIILAGDGGVGKTTVWCDLAAAVSSGKQTILDERPAEFCNEEPQKVIFFSSEDSLEFSLKGRLKKAGANMKNIKSVSLQNEHFSQIKFNSDLLRELIAKEKPALAIFDPLQGFIPSEVQMGQRNAMRACLSPLISIGEEFGTTSLIVVHTNKRIGTYGRNRIADSADIWDICRSALIVGNVPGSDIRYISHEKSNYGELAKTVLFRIGENGVEIAGYTDARDADYVGMRDQIKRVAPQKADAENFILNYLSAGKKPTVEMDKAASECGISNSSLTRAKTDLRKKGILESECKGFGRDKTYYSYLNRK